MSSLQNSTIFIVAIKIKTLKIWKFVQNLNAYSKFGTIIGLLKAIITSKFGEYNIHARHIEL